jgi:ATP-dependent RNA helicase DeaD
MKTESPLSDSPATHAESAAPASFDTFGLDPRIARALSDLGFENATPIQQKAIAPLLAGADVIGRARTGTGKTAAFGLPLVQRLAPPEGGGRAPAAGVKALVLAPTRELALQVSEALQSFAKYLNLRVATLYGGASYAPQLRALKDGAAIVVGTPGRLIDHLERGTLDLSRVEMVVLDEADEMLRMGFIDDVEMLVGATPPERQVALFSATMPDAIRRVADSYLKKPVLVQDESGPTSVAAISQQWIYVPQRFKGEALLRLLRGEPRGTTLVFARTRAGAGEAADALGRHGFQVEALHGDMSQSARERVLELFRARRLDVVVATDVAARGIDIDHITHVINFDLPENGEVYTHRIGRTGRAGRTGTAITLVTPSQIYGWRAMMRSIRAQVEEIQLPTDLAIVRRQQAALKDDLARAGASSRAAVAETWADAILGAAGWSERQLAVYALTLLADERGAVLEADPSDEPETWGQPQVKKKAPVERAPRGQGAREGYREGPPPARAETRAPRRERDERPEPRHEAPERAAPRRESPEQGAPRRDMTRLTTQEAPAPASERPSRARSAPVSAATPTSSEAPPRAEKPVRPERPARDERPAPAPRQAKAAAAPPTPAVAAPAKGRRKSADEVEVTFPAGKQQGVEPADIFGALTHEAGLTRDDIGRIAIHERVSVVRLPARVAAAVCDRYDALHVRGKKVPVIGPPPSVIVEKAGGPKGKARAGGDKGGPAKGSAPAGARGMKAYDPPASRKTARPKPARAGGDGTAPPVRKRKDG